MLQPNAIVGPEKAAMMILLFGARFGSPCALTVDTKTICPGSIDGCHDLLSSANGTFVVPIVTIHLGARGMCNCLSYCHELGLEIRYDNLWLRLLDYSDLSLAALALLTGRSGTSLITMADLALERSA